MKITIKKKRIPWNKGLTKDIDNRVNKNHWSKNKEIRQQVIKKLSIQKIGDKNPAKRLEVRKKISKSMKGKIPWNKNLKGWTKNTNAGFQKGNKLGGPGFKKGHIPWNYIDGKSKERYNNFNEWKKIAQKCYKRDNYTCQKCGKKGGILHAHHIIPWSISKNNSLSNLITLCANCHTKEHWRMKNDKN